MKNTTVNLGGLFLPALSILFIYLKLTSQIDWSWWWVLAPIWIPIAITILAVLVGIVWLAVSIDR